MTLTLLVFGHDFTYEMECVTRIFFANAKIKIVKPNNFTEINDYHNEEEPRTEPFILTMAEQVSEDELKLTVQVVFAGKGKASSYGGWDKVPAGDGGLAERMLAAILFRILSVQTDKTPPWGILTGIRPVRLCEQWGESGLNDIEIKQRLTQGYLVSPEKAELCIETKKAQEKILTLNKPDTFSLYVSIPFCPTRCLYCSFISQAVEQAAKLVPDYVRLLCDELRHIATIAANKGMRLLSVYVGGGTPTVLEAEQLEQILGTINSSFDLSHILEYTVEAGRPDTITPVKLKTLLECGAGRISINPQSMSDNVLTAIGRSHTGAQIEQAVNLARNHGFKSINMDLIAGLPEETAQSFAKSLDKVLNLSPENVTIHTLTVKRSSRLRENAEAFSRTNPETAEMLAIASEKIRAAGYFPYYLYRQKATVENLENIGFSKPGHEGVYNIYSMEDRHNIFAAGAGGVSKLTHNGSLKRTFNFKYPFEYISRFDEILLRHSEPE